MKRISLICLISLISLIGPIGSISPVQAQQLTPQRDEPPALEKGQAVEGQLLVKFASAPTITYESEIAIPIPFTSTRIRLREAGFAVKGNRTATNLTKKLRVNAMRVLGQSDPAREIALVQLPVGGDEQNAIEQYQNVSGIEIVEPNYLVTGLMTPNDPYFQRTTGQDYQWNFHSVRMPEAWDVPPQGGSPSIKVAVIDSGVAFATHTIDGVQYVQAPELTGVNFVAPKRFESLSGDCETLLPTPISDDHPHDQTGHGTHVTGTIVQATNNAQHAAGMAFNTSIIPIKVLTACTTGPHTGDVNGTTADVISGINHAVANGTHVINISIGTPSDSSLLHQTITTAVNAGATVVAASGNAAIRTSSTPIIFPAAYPEVIAVGATRFDGMRADYSQYGPELDLVAPGGQNNTDQFDDSVTQCLINAGVDFNAGIHCIFADQNNDLLPDGILQQTIMPGDPTQFTSILPSTIPGFTTDMKCIHADIFGQAVFVSVDQRCGLFNGTSMATPHVTAAAALMLSVNSSLTPAQIKDILTATASKTAIPGYTQTEHGAGLLDVMAALLAASDGTIPPPVSTPTPTPTGTQCLQVLTPARCIDVTKCALNQCQTFPTSCLPPGWTADPSCATTPTPRPTGWTTTEPFQLLVGDVNDSNTITIEDVSAVLSKYTDFKITVSDGTPVDVNADGFVTIEDVALVLLNYLDFTIPGEQP